MHITDVVFQLIHSGEWSYSSPTLLTQGDRTPELRPTNSMERCVVSFELSGPCEAPASTARLIALQPPVLLEISDHDIIIIARVGGGSGGVICRVVNNHRV